MDQTLTVGIISGVASIGAATITGILPLYLRNRKLKKEIRYVTTGMVVAYFFSFIKPLFNKLKGAQVAIKQDNNQLLELENTNKGLELVIPRTLDESGYEQAKKYVNSNFRRGVLVKGQDVLFRDIKYRTEPGANNAIILIDAPNILESAVSYFKESMRTTDFTISKEFKFTTEKELANFKSEINRMISNSEFSGKVSIIQL